MVQCHAPCSLLWDTPLRVNPCPISYGQMGHPHTSAPGAEAHPGFPPRVPLLYFWAPSFHKASVSKTYPSLFLLLSNQPTSGPPDTLDQTLGISCLKLCDRFLARLLLLVSPFPTSLYTAASPIHSPQYNLPTGGSRPFLTWPLPAS